jgi:hypothetical protein
LSNSIPTTTRFRRSRIAEAFDRSRGSGQIKTVKSPIPSRLIDSRTYRCECVLPPTYCIE